MYLPSAGFSRLKESFSSFPQNLYPHFEGKLRQAMTDLTNLEARVAQYMVLNLSDLSFETGASLASKVGVSEVTVSRLLRRLGYEGMRGLKRALQSELSTQGPIDEGSSQQAPIADGYLADALELEIKALRGVFHQATTPAWHDLVDTLANADRVYVTGFQTVRGLAEDCARRLALAKSGVRFLSAHDGMLAEWLQTGRSGNGADCLIMIDVVPYAREAPVLAEICENTGRKLVIVTDELCYWAKEYTDLVVHARSRNGLFLESTVAITAALNLLVHSVAEQSPAATEARLEDWKAMARSLNVF
jgi:DNA-binding MurR/RpiR family transcriptional regulator